MIERVYIPYEPKEGEVPPKGTQYQLKAAQYPNEWNEWHEDDPPLRVDGMHLSDFRFRVPAPEEGDDWEDVLLGGMIGAGDRKSFKGGGFCDVLEHEVGRRFLNDYLRVRRRKAVESPKPSQKPKNIDLMYLLERADKAINGDQVKAKQIIAAKIIFIKNVLKIMGVFE